jgi:hypothetical protein
MTGVIYAEAYPYRSAIHKTLKRKQYYKRVSRPLETEKKALENPTGMAYARLLSSAKIAITGPSRFTYPVLKYIEIPACRTALCSIFFDELGDLGFVPDENMISIKTISKTANVVEDWLSNPKLPELMQKGQDLVYQRHTCKKRAEELKQHFKLLSGCT